MSIIHSTCLYFEHFTFIRHGVCHINNSLSLSPFQTFYFYLTCICHRDNLLNVSLFKTFFIHLTYFYYVSNLLNLALILVLHLLETQCVQDVSLKICNAKTGLLKLLEPIIDFLLFPKEKY